MDRRLSQSALLAAAMLAALTGCSPAATPGASMSSSPPLSVPAPTLAETDTTSTPSANAVATSQSASPTAGRFAPDSMLKATIEGIRLREAPSVDAGMLGVLPVSSRSFVVSGPVFADGFEWYLLSGPGLPPGSGCATFPGPEFSCPVWFGWAATGNAETGDPWFIDDPTDCPDPATDGAAVMLLPDIEALHCYGGQQLVLTGWLPEAGLHEPFQCPTGVPSLTWLYCPDAYAATIFAVDDQAVSIEVFIDPASGEEFTGVDYWPIVMGHHDDPAAQGCDDAISPGHPIYPQLAVLECRARFVADQLGAVAP